MTAVCVLPQIDGSSPPHATPACWNPFSTAACISFILFTSSPARAYAKSKILWEVCDTPQYPFSEIASWASALICGFTVKLPLAIIFQKSFSLAWLAVIPCFWKVCIIILVKRDIWLFKSSFKLCTREDLSDSLILLVTALSLLNSAQSTSCFWTLETISFISGASAATVDVFPIFWAVCVYCLMAASWFTLTCISHFLSPGTKYYDNSLPGPTFLLYFLIAGNCVNLY